MKIQMSRASRRRTHVAANMRITALYYFSYNFVKI